VGLREGRVAALRELRDLDEMRRAVRRYDVELANRSSGRSGVQEDAVLVVAWIDSRVG
jgi:hypothetical protein